MAELATNKDDVVNIEASGTSAPAVGSTELPGLRSESERLKLERDNAQLRMELAQIGKPWWRKGSIVTMLTAIIAAVVPVTTAVQAHFQKERELALQESKQVNDIRASYLDRLDKSGARLRTLRFVLATTSDPKLRGWAEEETIEVKALLDDIDRRIAALNATGASAGSGAPAAAHDASIDPVLREIELRDKLDDVHHRLGVLKLQEQRFATMDPAMYAGVKMQRLDLEKEAARLEEETALWKARDESFLTRH
jgi:hypothetical protein